MPGYTCRVFVTSSARTAEGVSRDYNRTSDVEYRIAESKHHLGADGFCRKAFATE